MAPVVTYCETTSGKSTAINNISQIDILINVQDIFFKTSLFCL